MKRIAGLCVAMSVSVGWVAGAAAQSPAAATAFKVGTASAARGQTAYGAIEVPAGSDAALSIPVAVVNGAKPGPVLAIVSGSHGTEYASIIAVERLIQQLDAKLDPAPSSSCRSSTCRRSSRRSRTSIRSTTRA